MDYMSDPDPQSTTEEPILSGAPVKSSQMTYEASSSVTHGEMAPDPDSITSKARQSASALKDLVASLARKSKETVIQSKEELKESANNERPLFQQDATDIQQLGGLVDIVSNKFDETLDEIARSPYKEQIGLYEGFKKLLNEEINVVNARLDMASRMPSTPAQNETSDPVSEVESS
jgi:hypothetical protein